MPNTWNISGMSIVLRPITAKIKTCKQATKPRTNSHSCLQFTFLMPDWLFSCTMITFQKYFWCSRFSRFDCILLHAILKLPVSAGVVLCCHWKFLFCYSLRSIVHTMNRDHIMHQVVAYKRFKTRENNKTIRPNSGCGCLWEVVVLERLWL